MNNQLGKLLGAAAVVGLMAGQSALATDATKDAGQAVTTGATGEGAAHKDSCGGKNSCKGQKPLHKGDKNHKDSCNHPKDDKHHKDAAKDAEAKK